MFQKKQIFLLVISLLISLQLFSQQNQPKDSLVRLVEASSAHLEEADGTTYRKVTGSVRFLHNGTYLLCDTALWNVNTNVINAIGHVQIIQDNTFLLSDKINYIVDDNLAQFRGTLVELFDKDGNVLRTNHLDYNTKDSVATFWAGGSMRSKEGNVIESRKGEYRSADKTFTFTKNVQMFFDSVFIRSEQIDYNTQNNCAYFGKGTVAWQDVNMLFANDGEYDRNNNAFHFKRDSYLFTDEQELWADTLSYFRNTGEAELYDNIQILDTVQSVYCFADEAKYTPSSMTVELRRNPSIALYTIENGVKDTIFLAADTIKYYKIRYCDVDSSLVAQAKGRKKLSDIDPLAKIEEDAAAIRSLTEQAAQSPFINKKAAVAREREDESNPTGESDGEKPGKLEGVALGSGTILESGAPDGKGRVGNEGNDGVKLPPVSEEESGEENSSAIGDMAREGVAASDSTALQMNQVDTAEVIFIDAWRNVKLFKNDMQALCDTLIYTGLDSMARLYVNPVMWNDGRHQFSSDSMQIVIKDNVLSKANLISNAFVASQEDTLHYNQIKGAEMVAYFKDNDLYRYDALGGSSMIFYVKEDSLITIMNRKEGKIISARLKERQIQRIKYVENLKNDALPVYNLPLEEQRLKGFNWRGDERPVTRFDVSDRSIKVSEREKLKEKPFPDYPYTAVYFASTRDSILNYKFRLDSIRMAREVAEMVQQGGGSANLRDSLQKADRLADSLESTRRIIADTLALDEDGRLIVDSLAMKETELNLLKLRLKTRSEIKALPKEERKSVKREQKELRRSIKIVKKELSAMKKRAVKEEKIAEKRKSGKARKEKRTGRKGR